MRPPRLRVPADWFFFLLIACTVVGTLTGGGSLFVLYRAWAAGHPQPWRELSAAAPIAFALSVLLPALALAAERLGVEYVKIPEFERERVSPPSMRVRPSWLEIGGPVLALLAFGLLLVQDTLLQWLDRDPIGTVRLFGRDWGTVELAVIVACLAVLAWRVWKGLRRFRNLQREH